jgi:hypothetical protein
MVVAVGELEEEGRRGSAVEVTSAAVAESAAKPETDMGRERRGEERRE